MVVVIHHKNNSFKLLDSLALFGAAGTTALGLAHALTFMKSWVVRRTEKRDFLLK